MRKLINIVAFLALSLGTTFAQSTDAGRIILTSYVPSENSQVPARAQKILKNKLNQIATKNGMGGNSPDGRFIITPEVSLLTKDITPTAPPMTAVTIEVTLYIGDGVEGTLFSSSSLTLKGVGTNEDKAFISALKRINYRNKAFVSLIEEGKEKIVTYYESQCDFIIKEASTLADKKEYEEAILKLIAVPQVCKTCFTKTQDLSVEIYKAKMENDCVSNIEKAKAQNQKNQYDEAIDLLTPILPDVSCYEEAQRLMREIDDNKCASALGKAEAAWSVSDTKEAAYWLGQISYDSKYASKANELGAKIKTKVNKDDKDNWEYQLKQQKSDNENMKSAVEAAREIGISKAKNTPKTITYNTQWK